MARPTVGECSRLMLRLNSAGTVRRLDVLLMALEAAYETGRRDERAAMLAEDESTG